MPPQNAVAPDASSDFSSCSSSSSSVSFLLFILRNPCLPSFELFIISFFITSYLIPCLTPPPPILASHSSLPHFIHLLFPFSLILLSLLHHSFLLLFLLFPRLRLLQEDEKKMKLREGKMMLR